MSCKEIPRNLTIKAARSFDENGFVSGCSGRFASETQYNQEGRGFRSRSVDVGSQRHSPRTRVGTKLSEKPGSSERNLPSVNRTLLSRLSPVSLIQNSRSKSGSASPLPNLGEASASDASSGADARHHANLDEDDDATQDSGLVANSVTEASNVDRDHRTEQVALERIISALVDVISTAQKEGKSESEIGSTTTTNLSFKKDDETVARVKDPKSPLFPSLAISGEDEFRDGDISTKNRSGTNVRRLHTLTRPLKRLPFLRRNPKQNGEEGHSLKQNLRHALVHIARTMEKASPEDGSYYDSSWTTGSHFDDDASSEDSLVAAVLDFVEKSWYDEPFYEDTDDESSESGSTLSSCSARCRSRSKKLGTMPRAAPSRNAPKKPKTKKNGSNLPRQKHQPKDGWSERNDATSAASTKTPTAFEAMSNLLLLKNEALSFQTSVSGSSRHSTRRSVRSTSSSKRPGTTPHSAASSKGAVKSKCKGSFNLSWQKTRSNDALRERTDTASTNTPETFQVFSNLLFLKPNGKNAVEILFENSGDDQVPQGSQSQCVKSSKSTEQPGGQNAVIENIENVKAEAAEREEATDGVCTCAKFLSDEFLEVSCCGENLCGGEEEDEFAEDFQVLTAENELASLINEQNHEYFDQIVEGAAMNEVQLSTPKDKITLETAPEEAIEVNTTQYSNLFDRILKRRNKIPICIEFATVNYPTGACGENWDIEESLSALANSSAGLQDACTCVEDEGDDARQRENSGVEYCLSEYEQHAACIIAARPKEEKVLPSNCTTPSGRRLPIPQSSLSVSQGLHPTTTENPTLSGFEATAKKLNASKPLVAEQESVDEMTDESGQSHLSTPQGEFTPTERKQDSYALPTSAFSTYNHSTDSDSFMLRVGPNQAKNSVTVSQSLTKQSSIATDTGAAKKLLRSLRLSPKTSSTAGISKLSKDSLGAVVKEGVRKTDRWNECAQDEVRPSYSSPQKTSVSPKLFAVSPFLKSDDSPNFARTTHATDFSLIVEPANDFRAELNSSRELRSTPVKTPKRESWYGTSLASIRHDRPRCGSLGVRGKASTTSKTVAKYTEIVDSPDSEDEQCPVLSTTVALSAETDAFLGFDPSIPTATADHRSKLLRTVARVGARRTFFQHKRMMDENQMNAKGNSVSEMDVQELAGRSPPSWFDQSNESTFSGADWPDSSAVPFSFPFDFVPRTKETAQPLSNDHSTKYSSFEFPESKFDAFEDSNVYSKSML